MNIRLVKKEDVPHLVKLCEAHAIYEKAIFNPKNKEELLSRHLFDAKFTIKCLVVEQHGELIGYATYMKQFSTWDAHFYVYLDCLYLKEKARGQGIGSKLMNKVKEYAISEDCKVIEWQTPDFNAEAIEFYRKIGGKSNTKERFYWKI